VNDVQPEVPPRVLFLGGNGHTTERLAPARAAIADLAAAGQIAPFDLLDVAYPGFEDRPRAADLEAFLAALERFLTPYAAGGARTLIYATGIGGLLALCLRERGEFLTVPLLQQAPVLWGLERRWMPRLLRLGLAQVLLQRLFAVTWFQRRFARKQFLRPPSDDVRRAFFAGYARCPASADFFAWLTPALLRRLERSFAVRPDRLQHITVWWGEQDHVVNLQELRWTEQALRVSWPLRTFPHWAHYPMIDAPHDWVKELHDALAAAGPLPR
jgi:hypothetical protein